MSTITPRPIQQLVKKYKAFPFEWMANVYAYGLKCMGYRPVEVTCTSTIHILGHWYVTWTEME